MDKSRLAPWFLDGLFIVNEYCMYVYARVGRYEAEGYVPPLDHTFKVQIAISM